MRDDSFLKLKIIKDYFEDPSIAAELMENPDLDYNVNKFKISQQDDKILFVAKIQSQREAGVYLINKELFFRFTKKLRAKLLISFSTHQQTIWSILHIGIK